MNNRLDHQEDHISGNNTKEPEQVEEIIDEKFTPKADAKVKSLPDNYFAEIKKKSSSPNPLDCYMSRQVPENDPPNQDNMMSLVPSGQSSRNYRKVVDSHSNQPNSVRSQNNTNPYERLKPSCQRSSEQRLQSSNKYFKDQRGNHQNTVTTQDSAYVCLNRGDIIIRANEIETVVPCDVEKGFLPSGKSITRIYPNQQVKMMILPAARRSSSMTFDHRAQEFTETENNNQQKHSSSFMAQLSPFHQGLIHTLGKLFCLREYKVNCFSDSPQQLSSPSSSALAQIGDHIGSYQSSSSDRVCTNLDNEGSPKNSQKVSLNETNQNFFSKLKIPQKRSKSDEVSKKL